MWWLWLVGLTALFGSVVGVALMSARYRDRWGARPGPVVRAGDSPYRVAETRPEVPRGVPATARLAAGTGIAWGVITLLIFTPAGFLLMAVSGDVLASPIGGGLAAVLLLVVSCDAVALGFALVGVAPGVLRAGHEDRRAVRSVSVWSVVHHLLVLGTFGTLVLVEPDLVFLLVMALLPCLLGMGQAVLMRRASELEAPVAGGGNAPEAAGV